MNAPPLTPDRRYIVVRGRLWRSPNPALSENERQTLVDRLMDARRAVRGAKQAGEQAALAAAHDAIDVAKIGLGERGPPWWTDGAPDLNRHMARNTSYADWYASLPTECATDTR